jgi:hypothetical protein
MHRRNFLSSGLAFASAMSLSDALRSAPPDKRDEEDLVIDAHGHAGHGEALSAPWSERGDRPNRESVSNQVHRLRQA